jgi:hypothetical protein
MPSTYLARPSMRATLFLHATRAFPRALRPSESYLAWSCKVLRTLLRAKDGEIADARNPEGVLACGATEATGCLLVHAQFQHADEDGVQVHRAIRRVL